MRRKYLTYLQSWLTSIGRNPLILRGARQVGKTWLVRHLAQLTHKNLIELNIEKDASLVSLFKTNDPKQIIMRLEATFDRKIETHNSLLFIDEIQAAPELLAKLRWFAEDLPELPVIAAGSLLEFVLADHQFSMPVGRVSYMHVEPLSFDEFLIANNKPFLHDYLLKYQMSEEIPQAIHEQCLSLFKEYTIVGGMPAAVVSWSNEKSFLKINQIHYDLLATYRNDFAKYSKKIPVQHLDETMLAIPKMLGHKIIYSRLSSSLNSTQAKEALELLNQARICYKVTSTAANGVPLAAETRKNYFKENFLDTGLASAALGLTLNQIYDIEELNLINKGGIAEQVIGQTIRTIYPYYIEPALYYWDREERGSSAEVDYIIQHGNRVIPIEVKAGSTGTLKSLHLFMGLKNYPLAVRINSDYASEAFIETKNHEGKRIKYTLLSLPFYLAGQMLRLIDDKS